MSPPFSVLHCAVRSGNALLVDLVLRGGAKTDYVTDLGETVRDALPGDSAQRLAIEKALDKHRATLEHGGYSSRQNRT